MQKCVLNEFERKSIMNAFSKEYNVIKFVAELNKHGYVHYIFFFERGGYIFNTSAFYSSSLYKNSRPNLGSFIEYTREVFCDAISEIDKFLLAQHLHPDNSLIINAVKLKANIALYNRSFHSTGLTDCLLSDRDLDNVRDYAEDLLSKNKAPVEAFDTFYKQYKATDKFVMQIMDLKEAELEDSK